MFPLSPLAVTSERPAVTWSVVLVGSLSSLVMLSTSFGCILWFSHTVSRIELFQVLPSLSMCLSAEPSFLGLVLEFSSWLSAVPTFLPAAFFDSLLCTYWTILFSVSLKLFLHFSYFYPLAVVIVISSSGPSNLFIHSSISFSSVYF